MKLKFAMLSEQSAKALVFLNLQHALLCQLYIKFFKLLDASGMKTDSKSVFTRVGAFGTFGGIFTC